MSANSDQVESRVLGLDAEILAHQKLSSSLQANAAILVRLESGSNKSLNLKEFAPQRDISLRKAVLNWNTVPWFNLEMGILEQRHWDFPLFLNPSGSSIGMIQKFLYKDFLHLELQQSVLENRETFEWANQLNEGTPSLYTAKLRIPFRRGSFSIGHFAFKKLSRTSAYKSQFMGNSISPGTEQTAFFLYPYQGYVLNGPFWFPLSPELNLHVKGNYLRNIKAPKGRNEGFMGQIGVESPRFDLYGKYFYNQSDTSPGIYNDRWYGHNNRKGVGLEGRLKKILKECYLQFDYLKAQVLDTSILAASLQDDIHFVKISIVFTSLKSFPF